MKRTFAVLVALTLFSVPAFAGGLEDFLGSLNVQARADMNGFAARVSAQFEVPLANVQATIGTVREPADAFMVYQLGRMAGKPPETVVRTYQKNQGKGWGVIAKSLGIKPGSPAFHALKRGDFALTGAPAGAADQGHGQGKGKGKGHNK